MAQSIVFYEKPGCLGNLAQQKLLLGYGFDLLVRNLLETSWDAETLRSFFTQKNIREWFNTSAPSISSGTIRLSGIDEKTALQMMIREPILIRRPLLQYGDCRQAGFEAGDVFDALGLTPDGVQDLDGCQMPAAFESCGEVP
ncbi:MAG: hypothetical protein KDJ38_14580 [Gammaproteobacteria bacterium]|nr:hypothetical protein [Gammaproteobacteria bacterium]